MVLVVGCALALFASCKGHHAARMPQPSTVKSTTLQYPSGLRVLFEQHPGSERVAIAALVGAGSSDDPKGREGTAHFLEHLVFRSRPSGRLTLDDELDYAGVASAGNSTANAFTTFECTVYSGMTPKDRAASVLPLIASMLVQPLVGVDDQAFELERSVVRNEHLEHDPHGGGDILAAVTLAVFGAKAPNARPVGGTTESISAITRADVERFVQTHYRPEATTVVMVGDLEPEKIDAMVRASFPPSWLNKSGKPMKPLQLDRKPMRLFEPAPLTGLPVVKAPFGPLLVYAWMAPGTTEPGGQAIERFADAMRDEFKNIAKARGGEILKVDVVPGPVRSILRMYVAVNPGANPDDLNAALREHESFGNVTFGQWSNATLSSLFRDQDLQRHAEHRASTIFATGSTRPLHTVDTEVAAAVAWFRDEMLTWDNARLVVVVPAAKMMVDVRDLPPKVEASRRVVVQPEMVKSVSLPPPLPEVKRFTLTNGLQVVLSRRTPVPLVTVTLGLPAGSLHAKRGVSKFIGGLLDWKRESPEMERVPNPIVELRPDVTLVRLNHAAWNLPVMLDVLGHNLRPEVRFSPLWTPEALVDLVDGEIEKQREMEEEKRPPWQPPLDTLLPQVMAPQSSFMKFPTEDVKSLTQADFTNFVELAFRPNGAVLMIDGDHDLADTEKLVRELFSDWKPSQTPLPPLRDVGIAPAKQKKPSILPGPNLITEVRLMCRLPPARTIEQRGGQALLEYALELYFGDELRLARGLTYGVSTRVTDYRNEDNSLLLHATLDARADQEALSLFMERLHELEGAVWNEQVVDVARWRVAKRYMGTVATSPSIARLFAQEVASGASFEDTLALPLKLASTPLKYVDEAWAACSDTLALEVEGETFSIRDVLEPRAPLHQELMKAHP
jgi:predicted Zn-dependent peptidase